MQTSICPEALNRDKFIGNGLLFGEDFEESKQALIGKDKRGINLLNAKNDVPRDEEGIGFNHEMFQSCRWGQNIGENKDYYYCGGDYGGAYPIDYIYYSTPNIDNDEVILEQDKYDVNFIIDFRNCKSVSETSTDIYDYECDYVEFKCKKL